MTQVSIILCPKERHEYIFEQNIKYYGKMNSLAL